MSVETLRRRLAQFAFAREDDWATWMRRDRENNQETAGQFGRILRRWQACRPNAMRRTAGEAMHGPPYLEDLIADCDRAVGTLDNFELNDPKGIDGRIAHALTELWRVLTYLSYRGPARDGLAGVVGISKGVLFLTDGRIGPAFDSLVRRRLGTGTIADCGHWIECIRAVAEDIRQFEARCGCSLKEAVPEELRTYHCGKIYDMVFCSVAS
jgi:hypothetical protein